VLFVGQAPGPRSGASTRPFEGSYSGRRLASLLELSNEDMLARHDFVNLLDEFPGKNDSNHPRGDAFPLRKAREAARRIAPTFAGRAVVLLGRNVVDAFELEIDWFEWRPELESLVAACPHPSGVSHWWNSPLNVERARSFFRRSPFQSTEVECLKESKVRELSYSKEHLSRLRSRSCERA
jgi:uracil-DNA glycosylase